jgi:alpha-amylase/alpha-mannosidase (GH57 family)
VTPPISLVVHGHFYQPPRENPWTDEMSREPSAAPYHDWNARIHAESYRANAFARIHDVSGHIAGIVNNYSRLSFNFGPTLARWISRADPQVEARLRAADEEQRRRTGSGGALAMAYAHPIVPLCNVADRRTQLLWGLADFERRFGRRADGLWLPETAVSPATLETLIELGVKFTILAPEQIAAVRRAGETVFDLVDRDTVDTGRAYFWRHRDGSGRRIAIAVFDGPLSRAVAFGEESGSSTTFLKSVVASADRSQVDGPRLVLCASDGELWGHHKKFADLTLAYATHAEAERLGIEVTNLAAYLERHPPTWEVELVAGPNGEGTAWSCAHGLGRWQRDCGCNFSTAQGWNQKWRGPLRAALDLVRDATASFYEDAASELLVDPWGARDAYGDVVDASIDDRDAALAAFATPALLAGGEAARDRARLLAELQRATLLMYASCGWFFDDIAGLEGSLVIRMASHALDLLGQAGGRAPTADVLALLAEGKSNRAEEGTGADVFRRVTGDRVTPARAMGRAALGALVTGGPPEAPGYEVALEARATSTGTPTWHGALAGSARARHRRTGRRDEASILARAARPVSFDVRVGSEHMSLADLGDDAQSAIVMEALPALVAEAHDLEVARLIRVAARDVPPDRDTPEGVARRALLTRVIAALLAPEDGPLADEAAHIASDLVEAADLPSGGPDRREIEELVWTRLSEGEPSPALRGLASKLGFSVDGLAGLAAPPPPIENS